MLLMLMSIVRTRLSFDSSNYFNKIDNATSEISTRKIRKDNYPSEVYEDKAERIFFSVVCFCSALAYMVKVLWLCLSRWLCRTLHCISWFCLLS